MVMLINNITKHIYSSQLAFRLKVRSCKILASSCQCRTMRVQLLSQAATPLPQLSVKLELLLGPLGHFHSSSINTKFMQGAGYFSLNAFLKTTMLLICSLPLLCSFDIKIMLKSSNRCMFTYLNGKVWQKTATLVLVLSVKLGECVLLGKKVKSTKQLL